MTGDEVREIVQTLAQSQGSYGRMLEAVDEADQWEEVAEAATNSGVTGAVDLILFLEGC